MGASHHLLTVGAFLFSLLLHSLPGSQIQAQARAWPCQLTMDPISAFGLAANIIGFVDFSSKLVKAAAEVRRSSSGTTQGIQDAAAASETLQAMLADLQTPQIPNTCSDEDKNLLRLANDCKNTCADLEQLIRKIRGKPSSSGVGPAWRAWRKSGEISALEIKLARFRAQILGHVTTMMRYLHALALISDPSQCVADASPIVTRFLQHTPCLKT